MTSSAFTRTRLVAAHEDAADFYRQMLLGPHGAGPRRYLTDRGFKALLDQTRWTVGYAPPGWTHLRDHLHALGYRDETLLAAGLARLSRRGTPIDCFRDRITFGIRDLDGSLIGFTARRSPTVTGHAPKYLNTHTTAIYNKTTALFGLGEASKDRDRLETLVLTEGPLDAIAVDLARRPETGNARAVALCGTAITGAHRQTINGLGASEIILAFDNDDAGTRATETAYKILRGIAQTQTVSPTGNGDLAELLRRGGPNCVRDQLSQSRPAVDAIIDTRIAGWPGCSENAEAAIACLRSLARLLSELSPNDMARQATRLHEATQLPTHLITRELVQAFTAD